MSAAALDAAAEGVARFQRSRDLAHDEKRATLWSFAVSVLTAPFVIFDGAMSLSPWFVGIFASGMVFYCGRAFHRGMLRALRRLSVGSDVLISFSLLAAWAWSVSTLFTWEWLPKDLRRVFWNELAVLVVMSNFGRYLAVRLRWYAGEAVGKLAWLAPKSARVLRDGRAVSLLLDEVEPGDRIVVRPGEQIPVDGEVVSGTSRLDERLLTGQDIPTEKGPGSKVLAGAINRSGELEITAVRVGRDRMLVAAAEHLRGALAARPAPPDSLEETSAAYMPWMLFFVLIAAAAWFSWGPEPRWLYPIYVAVSMCVVAAPVFAAAAAPVASTVGQLRLGEAGGRMRDAGAVERYGAIDAMLFEKSGILTRGYPRVVDLRPADGATPEELLREALFAESRSDHPYARALREYAGDRADAPSPDRVEVAPGRGALSMLHGKVAVAGTEDWLAEHGVAVPPGWTPEHVPPGHSLLLIGCAGKFLGAVELADAFRPEAAGRVRDLKQEGLKVVLVSGDRDDVVRWAAEEAGIGEYRSGVFPESRAAVVEEFQKTGHKVLVVGEGFKAVPALARADLGLAVGASGDVAVEAADVSLRDSGIASVVTAVRLLGRANAVLRQNLAAVFAVHTLLVFVAAGGLFPLFGVMLDPRAALLGSGVGGAFVVLNTYRLWRTQP